MGSLLGMVLDKDFGAHRLALVKESSFESHLVGAPFSSTGLFKKVGLSFGSITRESLSGLSWAGSKLYMILVLRL